MNKLREYLKNRNEKKWQAILMAPSLIGVGLFFVLPFFVIIYYQV